MAESSQPNEQPNVPESAAAELAVTPSTADPTPSPTNTPQEPMERTPDDDVAPSPAPATDSVSEKVQLAKGETLRILAEKLFGSREFWIYIYLENRDLIGDPNRVPAGITLRIPDRHHYHINASDTQSVRRAKELGDKMMQS